MLCPWKRTFGVPGQGLGVTAGLMLLSTASEEKLWGDVWSQDSAPASLSIGRALE